MDLKHLFGLYYSTTLLNGRVVVMRIDNTKFSKEEEEAFYNRQLNVMDGARNKDRFNRKINEPVLEPSELKKREQIIERLLKKCARLIGKEPEDRHFRLDLKEGDIFEIFSIAIRKTPDPEYARRAQPIYLTGHMQKCTRYLYPTNLRTATSAYNFSDFEYQSNDLNNVQDQLKKQKIEKLYEEIYLEVKSAGLLRKVFYTYYPKSFLREHADQTGLTQFIQEKEAKAGKPLLHDELATEFFGSREKWIESFDQFINQKINQQSTKK